MADRPRHIVIALAPGCPPAWRTLDGRRFARPSDLDLFVREVVPGVRVAARPDNTTAIPSRMVEGAPAEIWIVGAPGWSHDQQAGIWTLRTDDDIEVGAVSDSLILHCDDRDSLAREVARKFGSLPPVLL